jgi:hypothetical protein
VLLNGVKALVAKVGGTEALKIIAKETAMSIKDAGAFVNDLVRGHNPDCCYQQAFDFSVFLLVCCLSCYY